MMVSALFGVVSAGHLAVALWGAHRLRRNGNRLLIVPLLLCMALVYDNAVIAVGAALGPGAVLEVASIPRFAVHAVLTPTLILWAQTVACRAGVRWADSRAGTVIAWALALGSIAVAIVNDVVGLSLRPLWWAGTLRYANIPVPDTEALPVVITGVFVLVAGIGVWQRRRWLPMMLTAAVMTFAAAVAPESPLVGNMGELVLAAGLMGTAHWLRREPDTAALPATAVAKLTRRAGWIAFPALVVTTLWPGVGVVALVQPVYEILLVVHAQLGITTFGLPPKGNRLRRFHTGFGYANIPLLAAGQLLGLFPPTRDLAAAVTWALLISITVHIGIGVVFALRRRAARPARRAVPSKGPRTYTNSSH
ncbi:hypothetical protein AB0L82_33275 [Nocardia sp. NPDC052001]|uniref:hypothetical protein n=1 Tax=Nocardia sp. NPDC052001 TaxID=3154853 RepID=UPI0034300DC7